MLAGAVSQVVAAASRDDTLPDAHRGLPGLDGETLTLAATDRYRLAVRESGGRPCAGICARPPWFRPGRWPTRRGRWPRGARVGRLRPRGSPRREAGRRAPAGRRDDQLRGWRPQADRPADRRRVHQVPVQFPGRVRLPGRGGRRAFTEAVRRVSLVADRASPVRLASARGHVVVEAHAEAGPARWRPSRRLPGTERVIAFNPHYLLDGLGAAAAPAQPQAARRGAPATRAAARPGRAQAGSGERAGRGQDQTNRSRAAQDRVHQPGQARADHPGHRGTAAAQRESLRSPAGEQSKSDFRYLVVPLRAATRS